VNPTPQIEGNEGLTGLSQRLLEEASKNASIMDRHIKTISEAFSAPESLRQAATLMEFQKNAEILRRFEDSPFARLQRELVETAKLYEGLSRSPVAQLAEQIAETRRTYVAITSPFQRVLQELEESSKIWRELRSDLSANRWVAAFQVLPPLPSFTIGKLSDQLVRPINALLGTQRPFEALLNQTDTLQSVHKLSASLRQQLLNRHAIESIYPHRSGSAEYKEQLSHEVEEIENRVEQGLETLLETLDPDLVKIWRGACERVRTKGDDWIRQALTSLRELSTHVLHLLAPDDEVERLCSQKSCPPEIRKKDNRGNPARSARLYLVYQRIEHVEMREFVKADIKASLSLFDLLNSGTHRIASELTEREVTSILRKVESTLQFLIESMEG